MNSSDPRSPIPDRAARLVMALTAATLLAAAAGAGAEEPRPGETVAIAGTGWAYRYEIDRHAGSLRLFTIAAPQRQAVYSLGVCAFCAGNEDNCHRDGLFPLRLVEAPAEPVVVAVCHVGAHSQQAKILAPLRDPRAATLAVTGQYAVVARPQRDGIVIERDELAAGQNVLHRSVPWPGPEAGRTGMRAPDWRKPPPAAARDAPIRDIVTGLADIVRRRDANALRALLAPDVLVSFGGDGGPADFIQHWALDDAPQQSPVWDVLSALLRHNPAVERDGELRLVFPYYFSGWPHDGYGYRFAYGSGIALRAGPHDRAPVLRRIGFEAVIEPRAAEGWDEFAEMLASDDDAAHAAGQPQGRWVAVITRHGEFGYVDGTLVPGITGYRLSLVRTESGAWHIDMLVAGD